MAFPNPDAGSNSRFSQACIINYPALSLVAANEENSENPRTHQSPPPPPSMGKRTSCSSNKRPPPPTAPAQYKGVRRRTWGSWVSEIRAPHQKTRIWLGSYSTPEAAARAYDAALLCLKGSSASFNFPAALPHPVSATAMSPKSIQRLAAAAAAAANHSPPPPPGPPSSEDAEEDRRCTGTSEEKVDDRAWINDGVVVLDFGGFQYDPKCLDDHMAAMSTVLVSSSSSSPCCSWEEECEEMGDLNLWSFC